MKSNTATATTVIAERPYVGRFAPSPTGDLHLGSLFTAVASFLDARSVGGRWLLRIEDLDTAREVPGATDRILRCLERFGLYWDGTPLRQRGRESAYREALGQLHDRGYLYPCSCSRQQLKGHSIYPGICRSRPPEDVANAALRFRLHRQVMRFTDEVQGAIEQDPALSFGDFIVARRDGITAYMLAVVVDDAAQGITHVVRGADLLDSTLPQVQLQRALGLPQPVYAHVPLLVEQGGGKLAKSARSMALARGDPARLLHAVLVSLRQSPPDELVNSAPATILQWALKHWRLQAVEARRELEAP